jgi:hypothetical protein
MASPFGLLCLSLMAAVSILVIPHENGTVPAIALPAGVSSRFQAGDLIFRIGSGWRSDTVRGMARTRQEKQGDPYSHVGMLVGSPAHWQVIHAAPAEKPGRADAVVIDDLDFFLSSKYAKGVAIYRVDASAGSRVDAVKYALHRLGTPFRIVEDDTEGQYCTTLVWVAWQRAGVDLGVRFERLEIPFAAGDYLLPHNLRVAPGLQLVFETPAGKYR